MLFNKNNFTIQNILSSSDVLNRPVISGLRIEESRTIATDSYKLLTVDKPKADVNDFPEHKSYKPAKFLKPCIIPAKIAKETEAKLNKIPAEGVSILKHALIGNQTTADQVELITTDLESADRTITKKIEGDYPKIDSIIPKSKPKATILLGLDNLKSLIDTLKKMSIEDPKSLKISLYGKDRPLLIEATTEEKQKITGLIMPLKSED